jgi:hypothetical protein
MGKRNRNLFDKIVEWNNLIDAHHKTSNGKKRSYGFLEFKEHDMYHLRNIQKSLIDGTYQRGDYREFIIREPKPRLISALDFGDRLVQHALCNVITPIFEKSMLPYSFACRKDYGTHAGVKHIQKLLRKHQFKYFLKTDFKKFFPSIDLSVLKAMIEKKIHCSKTKGLIYSIVGEEGKGIPIGSLTSQLFANVYGNIIDYHMQHALKQKYWARYMDDIVVLGNSISELKVLFDEIKSFAKNVLLLDISRWQISPVSKGVNFLGYRIWQKYKLIRKSSVLRAKRKIRYYLKNNKIEELNRFIASWKGHISWANSHNLQNYLNQNFNLQYT